ncbi:DNA topoisomerase VI subunit B [Sulfurisphaera ohwakuensis]|uniref:Type 2 DNA topoisomerase 6 subunit B n=1 Tax=Sulfurisphaera ohwakuensis TaxID=69656 RepID=A0A650CGY4_SULOH|nr:DNA topoisomerase VI subunit B [Sulfurisphaera ohwakuensis]MBB5252512.1 DNA topoisomerase-6 subunit B [Sulfurisphaera ohwakuensis]QGR17043.1 DNA topoisomerase VI subunit B [Sulfurisphaera ohwakuensis]
MSSEKFTSISPAEFFKRNPELAGFSNPARALYQTVRELVENALDATDVHNILPSIKIIIELVDPQKQIYKVNVEDNGIGIPPHIVPNAFGKVLYSSKYVLRQTRGMYGLGVKAAVLYSQMYQERPVEVVTSPINSKRIYFFKLKIDVVKNEPIILQRTSVVNEKNWHGTSVTLYLYADWQRAKQKIYEYVKKTYIISPYAEFFFKDPDNNVIYYKRLTDKIPEPPKEVKPHPYGVDIELIKFMIVKKDKPVPVRDFLINEFQSIGDVTADKILEMAKLPKDKKTTELTDEEISRLVEVMKKFDDFRPPSAEALSVIGEDLIKLGLKSIFNPEFAEAITRKPKAYQGHPFIVEAGIAYGGAIQPSPEPIVLRYANKIPLIYDEKSDVIWKVVTEEMDWKRYGIEEEQPPLVVMVHLCSTKVPYRSAGKESIADVEEIEKEIKLALMDVARKLKKYITEKRKEEEAKKRLITYLKYIPEVSRGLALFLVGGDKQKIGDAYSDLREKLLKIALNKLEVNDKKLEEEIRNYKVEEL